MAGYPTRFLIAVGSGPIPPWYYNASPGGGSESKMPPPSLLRDSLGRKCSLQFWLGSGLIHGHLWPRTQNRTRTAEHEQIQGATFLERHTLPLNLRMMGGVQRTPYTPTIGATFHERHILTRRLEIQRNILIDSKKTKIFGWRCLSLNISDCKHVGM